MSDDDTRRHYDRAASDWWIACEAISAAAGPTVTIPTVQMATILLGYQQLKAERDAALKLLDAWNRAARIDRMAVLEAWHALGVISTEEWENHQRRAAATDPAPADQPTVWDDSVPPGGRVCAVPMHPGSENSTVVGGNFVCGMPVESEPCAVHFPQGVAQ